MNRILILLAVLSLTGCASTIEAWKGRPWGSHNYRADKLYVGSADRRVVITGMVGSNKVACPELIPEIAVSRGASSTPLLTLAENKSLSLADAITVAQMKGHEMDASSQKYAMIQWTLCTAYLNKTLSLTEYKAELLKLVKAGTDAMLEQAKPPPEPKATPSTSPSGSPDKPKSTDSSSSKSTA